MGEPLKPKRQVELSREDFISFVNLPFCFWRNRAGERRARWSLAIVSQGLGIGRNKQECRWAAAGTEGIDARR